MSPVITRAMRLYERTVVWPFMFEHLLTFVGIGLHRFFLVIAMLNKHSAETVALHALPLGPALQFSRPKLHAE